MTGERVTWADALLAMADRPPAGCRLIGPPCWSTSAPDPTDNRRAHLHHGPALPDTLRRYLSCDTRIRPVWETDGRPVSVGRTQRTVPERTRIVIEDRDRGCRTPGCPRTRWLHIHHIVHWEDGGPTDTTNLIALCPHHHRAHHHGLLGITGNADQPHGIQFTDQHGRPLKPNAPPTPPGDPPGQTAPRLGIQPGHYHHPTGEPLQTWSVPSTNHPDPPQTLRAASRNRCTDWADSCRQMSTRSALAADAALSSPAMIGRSVCLWARSSARMSLPCRLPIMSFSSSSVRTSRKCSTGLVEPRRRRGVDRRRSRRRSCGAARRRALCGSGG